MPDASPGPAALPRIDELVRAAPELVQRHGQRAVTDAVRDAVDAARTALLAGGAAVPTVPALVAQAGNALDARRPGPPRAVINATGVVVHTNLGRAPLSPRAREAVAAAGGYCDVEYDLQEGRRSSRGARLDPLLAEACGAEAGIAVNNAAAALVLVLGALARGREVVVSRGELVEIGGSFRLPEILAAAGARLVEVGTTNRTRAEDYLAGDDVALLMVVHPSNYRVIGFTGSPELREVAAVARARGVPLLHDVGSGLLTPPGEAWASDEPSVSESLAAGADLVVCSGDKLLGGPQAGLLVGAAGLVAACDRHPLARALRLDKLRIAALVATLESHLRGVLDELPVWAALHADPGDLLRRSTAVAQRTGGAVADGAGVVGGGSAPGRSLPGPVVRIPTGAPEAMARRLRQADPPIIARVADGALELDLRAVAPGDDDLVAARVAAAGDAVSGGTPPAR